VNTARILTGIPLLIMIMLVAVVGLLEYVHLTTSGLWLDELSSIFFSETSESLSYLYYSRMVQDTSPPLYYILLHYWMLVFGEGEYPVRVFGWLAALATFVATYVLALKVYGRSIAIVLAASLFCSPGLVQYGLEARVYVFLLLFTPLLILQAIYLCNQIESGRPPEQKALLLFVIYGLCASLMHYSCLFLYAVLGLYLLYFAGTRGGGVARVLLYGVCTVVIYMVWITSTLGGIGHRLGAGSGPGFDADLASNLYTVMVLSFGSIHVAGLLVVPVLVAAIRHGPAYYKSQDFIVPIISIAGVILIYWAISLHTVIMTPRNFLVLLPTLLILSVVAAKRTLPGACYPWAGGILCMLFVLHAPARVSEIKSEMREAASYIASLTACGSGEIYSIPDMGRGTHHFRYYLPGSGLQLITDRQGPFEPYNSRIMAQQCPVVLWIMHWTDQDEAIIRMLGLPADRLQAVRFVHSTVYIRKAGNS
jgi:hypothetical protein